MRAPGPAATTMRDGREAYDNRKANIMTKQQQKRFARRFGLDDWQALTGKVEFLDALDTRTEAEAEVVAWRILNPASTPTKPANPKSATA